MSQKTEISWCDSTANPVVGCSASGCEVYGTCYARQSPPARVWRSKGVETFGPRGTPQPVKGFERAMMAMNLRPWICDKCGGARVAKGHPDSAAFCGCLTKNTNCHRRRIFCNSLSDWLDPKWPVETLARFLDVLRRCDQCTLILCTKQPRFWPTRMEDVLDERLEDKYPAPDLLFEFVENWKFGGVPQNVIQLTTVTDQRTADLRIPHLLRIPAACRGLSLEPMLGPVNLYETKGYWGGIGLGWCIAGLESGPHRRPGKVEWLADVAAQCKAAGVPFWCKQDNAQKPGQQGRIPDELWRTKQFPDLCQL